jgi:hypothetical protein
VVPLFVVTAVATAVLWPGAAERASAENLTRYGATVQRVVTEARPDTPQTPEGVTDGPCGTVTVTVTDGPDAGRQVGAPIRPGPARRA